MKNLFIFLFGIILFLGCTNEGQKNESTTDATTSSTEPKEEKEPELSIRSQITAEDDYLGRMKVGLSILEQEYKNASGVIEGIGNVTIDIDEKANMVIKNEVGSDLMETKVNLKNLNTAQGGFSLIPDNSAGEFPGLRVKTINEEPLVELLKNGELVTKNNELVIFLPSRPAIEKITPALLQTIRIAEEIK